MIFFKKQHEEIANGFLARIDILLRNANKEVIGYAIDGEGIETLKVKVAGKTMVEMKIEGEMWHHSRPEISSPSKDIEPIEDVKEAVY